MQDVLLRLRYRYWPDHLLGEILSKRWTETAIPVIVLLIITILLSRAIPGFLTAGGLADTGRHRRDARLRRGARRRQRSADRLSAAAGLHHHADHADHLPLRLRSAAVRLFQQDRGGLSRFSVVEF